MRTIARVGCVAALLVFVGSLRAGDDAKPREIVAKGIEAHGGADAIKKLRASVVKSKGKFHGKGFAVDFTGETAIQMPDRIRQQVAFEVNEQKGAFVWVFDGDKGWLSVNGMAADMPKEMIAEGQEQQYAQSVERLVPLTDKAYKLSSLGESKVGDHAAQGVRVEREGHRAVELFFDKESGLLLKSVTRSKTPMSGDQEFTAEKIYDDYQKVEGLMVARKVTIKHDGKDFADSVVTDVKVSEKLDDNVFAKP
jgi:hypothetical protein